MKARKAAKLARQRETTERPLAVPPSASKPPTAEPTPERVRHGAEAYVYLGRRAAHSFLLADKLETTGKITEAQRKASERYAEHWAGSGMAGHCPAIDMDRVGGGAGASFMPSTEYEAMCRIEYRKAVKLIGLHDSALLERLICHDHSLTDVGRAMGYSTASQASAAGLALLQITTRRLVVHYDL